MQSIYMITITMYIVGLCGGLGWQRLARPAACGRRRSVSLCNPGIMVRMAESDLICGVESFVALGDSFTEGLYDYGTSGGLVGWADRLAEVLSAQVPEFRYANLAIRGKLVREVLQEQIDPAIAMAPDLVSFAAGGNDILRGTDVDKLAELFDSGVARLQGAGCRVLIFTGFDPRDFPVIRLLRGKIAAYNMHLRGIADERGCDLVDLWSMRALRDPRAWSPDRLHLTTEGHRLVALRACDVLGLPASGDWRAPVNGRGLGGASWVAARREDVRWAREYAMPWLNRRIRGTSSGDEVAPKRPELEPVR
jgi:lysophospholipase L1-like esterase